MSDNVLEFTSMIVSSFLGKNKTGQTDLPHVDPDRPRSADGSRRSVARAGVAADPSGNHPPIGHSGRHSLHGIAPVHYWDTDIR